MTNQGANVVICGAGIAGIATAYHLSVGYGIDDIVLVDDRPPLSMTSDKSTECYRNWWPGPGDAMVRLMNRSIDLLEGWADQTGNAFHMNRRGYLFATAREEQAGVYRRLGEEAEANGAGPLRIHRGAPGDPEYQPAPASGYRDQPTGADLIVDPDLIQAHFPYLTDQARAVLHARRSGWFSAQQLGTYLLEQAVDHGARLVKGRIEGVDHRGGRVRAAKVRTEHEQIDLTTDHFVIAAGPKAQEVAGMVGVDLPMYCELHSKVSMPDRSGAVPRDAPLLIWSDPQQLSWSQEEVDVLEDDPEVAWLLEELPAGAHGRPEGPDDSPMILLLWTYHTEPVEPTFPPDHDEMLYPEIALRGLSTMVPALEQYIGRMPRPFVDGGYYAKTRENRPLIGPLPVEGAYLIGALSGFGLMASPAAGELLAQHITGSDLPEHEWWFRLDRYENPEYQMLLENWGSSGQL
ncbi:MAG: FAD-dependent oxidoreductase [Anaerolineales bacterium]|nr:FAD-dependent oxidoreductase [Anaerolineales bacterium]